MTNSFSLSKTKQRSYEWRGNFAAAAITVIQDFWNSDPQYASAEDRANFVEWAIPSDDEEPSPFTWASVDEADSDHIVSICYFAHLFFSQIYSYKFQVYKGSFQSYIVIATFSAHIASISHLPSDMLINNAPSGALSMATTSVGHKSIIYYY